MKDFKSKTKKSTEVRRLKKGPGKETWIIDREGRSGTVTTSRGSIRAMDKAVGKYSGALKRLADK